MTALRVRGRRATALALTLTLGLAACGGDDDPSDDAGTDVEADVDAGEMDDDMDDDMSEDEMDDMAAGLADECAAALTTPDTLTVATGDVVFPPWMEDDDPTNGRGFESALVYEVAERLGLDEVAWVRTGFDEAIAPGSKDYDFNIQQYSITAERDEAVDFSTGYYQVEQAIIGSPGAEIAGASSLADLQGARLGAAIGTTSLDYIDNVIQPDEPAQVYDDNAASKAAFDAGQVDGIVYDLPTAYFITAVEITDAEIIGVLPRVQDDPEELGMLFEEGSALVPCVNDALAHLGGVGTIEELEDEWLNQGGGITTLSE